MKRFLLILLGATLLAGCDEQTTLFSGLDETQANPVIAALSANGIASDKQSGDEGTWVVMVGKSDFARAANICAREGLPRRQFAGVGDVFKKTGMVSSPTEERIRFMDASAQDLARTIIEMIDGVVDARVHVVLPANDPFAKNTLPSSVAVAVRARWDADVTPAIPQIKSFVKNAIEGLSIEKITVEVFQGEPPRM